jgi:uncharacterized lipoprotein YmbA
MTFRWLAIALLLGACATAAEDDTRYYLLPKPKPAERVVFTDDTVALRELDLPLYARAAEIAFVAADGAVAVSDDNRWADEPARAMTRALAGSLREAIGAPVVVEPWGRAIKPVLRIDVTVDRFIGTPGGEVALTGDFRIVSLDDRQTVSAQGFDIAVPTTDAGFDALTRAHSVALARLSDEIVIAIREDAIPAAGG